MYLGGAVNNGIIMIEHKAFIFQIKLHSAEDGDMELAYPLVPSDKEPVSPYSFRKETYANGDVFFGEFYEGRRNGYGVYCWANGDIWYGQYKGGYRNGYLYLCRKDIISDVTDCCNRE